MKDKEPHEKRLASRRGILLSTIVAFTVVAAGVVPTVGAHDTTSPVAEPVHDVDGGSPEPVCTGSVDVDCYHRHPPFGWSFCYAYADGPFTNDGHVWGDIDCLHT